ncbi:MAG: chitinase, partial [Microthrixaceae bacterium]
MQRTTRNRSCRPVATPVPPPRIPGAPARVRRARFTSGLLAMALLAGGWAIGPARAVAAAPVVPFRPYIDATLWPTPDLAAFSSAGGGATLGFVVDGGGCRPSWGTYYDVTGPYLATDIAAARAAGRDLIVSFGGAANTELAVACPTAAATQAAYQQVVDRYGIRHLDFDIEGAALADRTSVDRRNRAVADLQGAGRADGRPVTVSYTLPVLPSGLTPDGVALLRSAVAAGVDVAVVNLMTMDYGAGAAPSPAGRMGRYAIDALNATKSQLASVWPARSEAALWAGLGATPMIGQNDLAGEVFDTTDAAQLAEFARSVGLGRLAMWSAARDVPCAGGPSTVANNLCSGVTAAPGSFAALLSGTPLTPPSTAPTTT